MAPPRRHSHPYKVSSDDWVVSSEALATSGMASEVMGMGDLNTLQIEAHMKGALKVFVNIYTLAKILHVAFLAYGAEVGRAFIISARNSPCLPAPLFSKITNKRIALDREQQNWTPVLDQTRGSGNPNWLAIQPDRNRGEPVLRPVRTSCP